ncbi:MAG: hypothetical protein JJ902_11700 [Roseibium sp.]|nr:hypothetical protein [Roseibium sp.]
MRFLDYQSIYKNKKAYNLEDILLDTLASIRQEQLAIMAEVICYRVAKHHDPSNLKGHEIQRFDELIRPLIMASRLQRIKGMQPRQDD